MTNVLGCLIAIVGIAHAEGRVLRCDSADPAAGGPLTLEQLSVQPLTVFSYTEAEKDAVLSGDIGVFGYGTNWEWSAEMVIATGAPDTVNDKWVFNFAPSNFPVAGAYWYQVGYTNADGFHPLGRGALSVLASPMAGGPGVLNLATILNWQAYTFLGAGPWVADVVASSNTAAAALALSLSATGTAARAEATAIAASNTASTALQPSATNSLASTGYVNTATAGLASTNDLTAVSNVAAGKLSAESDTLESVAARGGFAGTENIAPLKISSYIFGQGAATDASGINYGAYGIGAGYGSTGDSWNAYGAGAGFFAQGNQWGAYGTYAGWESINANSHFFGRFAGRSARGDNRLYIDVYETDPSHAVGAATNDMIFGDNGQLNLGRTGPLTNASPNQLRGSWNIGTPTGSGSGLTGVLKPEAGSYATNFWAGPASAQSVTNATTVYFTW